LVMAGVSLWSRPLGSRFGAEIAPLASFGLWRVDEELPSVGIPFS
jgi:hypothetical protein